MEIAEESGDPENVRTRLAGISSDVAELERLVADVLAVSRLGAAGEDVRIGPAAARFEEIAAGAAERFRRGHPGRELRLEIAEGLPLITVDAALIGRALDNLLENAARYSDAAQPVHLRGRVEEPSLVVEVTDRGIGVAAEDLPRLFEPFSGPSAAAPGTPAARGSVLASASGSSRPTEARSPRPRIPRGG